MAVNWPTCSTGSLNRYTVKRFVLQHEGFRNLIGAFTPISASGPNAVHVVTAIDQQTGDYDAR
jgi:hypothetical protein